jgi:hypothetical protein
VIANTPKPEGERKLCHNCDTKPAFAGKTDFANRSNLLILWNLLKAKEGSKIPAYRLIRHIIYSQILIKNAAIKFPSANSYVIYQGKPVLFLRLLRDLHTNRYPRRNDKTPKVFLLASRRTVQR